jgi:AraC-like DNA-binding protein
MIRLYKPENPSLQRYIECIYLFSRTNNAKPFRYLTFPSIFSIATISESSRSVEEDGRLRIEHYPSNQVETNLACTFTKPVLVQYTGPVNEITIYFKPLGINAFLNEDLDAYATNAFPDFNPFNDYKERMAAILALKSDAKKIICLEKYWLSRLKGFRHSFLEKAVAQMTGKDAGLLTSTTLANSCGVSRATFNKHFLKHICKTPSQFKKVMRFRNAMGEFLLKKGPAKLTSVTHSLDYFDQSHMVKDFKALTGYPPKVFFAETKQLGDGHVNWLFL